MSAVPHSEGRGKVRDFGATQQWVDDTCAQTSIIMLSEADSKERR